MHYVLYFTSLGMIRTIASRLSSGCGTPLVLLNLFREPALPCSLADQV